jgi:lipopolysaccharide export system protein LptA
MTRERMAGQGDRLTGDTLLRSFHLTGGRPRVLFSHQPAPLVAAGFPVGMRQRLVDLSGSTAQPAAAVRTEDLSLTSIEGQGDCRGYPRSRWTEEFRFGDGSGERTASALRQRAPTLCMFTARQEQFALPAVAGHVATTLENNMMVRSSAFRRLATLGTAAAAAVPQFAARAETQQRATVPLSSTVELVANVISSPGTNQPIRATGNVIVKGPQGILYADQVDVIRETGPAPPGTPRSPVQVAKATGHVRVSRQSKPDERLEATGTAGTFWPGTHKATLTGGVTVTATSPQLQEPAVLTGSRAEMNLAARTAEVFRTPQQQVALKLLPKQATAPVNLTGDRILMENATDRVTATGSPVLTGEQGIMRAEKIWFTVDPDAKNVKEVHGDGSVNIDAHDPQQGRLQATSQHAVMNQVTNDAVLTGDVDSTITRPDDPAPQALQTDQLIYNVKTGAFQATALPDKRVRARFHPTPKANK